LDECLRYINIRQKILIVNGYNFTQEEK